MKQIATTKDKPAADRFRASKPFPRRPAFVDKRTAIDARGGILRAYFSSLQPCRKVVYFPHRIMKVRFVGGGDAGQEPDRRSFCYAQEKTCIAADARLGNRAYRPGDCGKPGFFAFEQQSECVQIPCADPGIHGFQHALSERERRLRRLGGAV